MSFFALGFFTGLSLIFAIGAQNIFVVEQGLKKQFVFIKDINKTLDNTHKSIKKIRKINEKLDAFMAQYKGNDNVKDLVEKAKTLKEEFSKIEKALYQTKNRSGQEPLNFPIRLNNKLAHLNSLVGRGDFAPTNQDVAVKNELTQKINTQLKKFDDLVTKEINAFNQAFNDKKLNFLFVED